MKTPVLEKVLETALASGSDVKLTLAVGTASDPMWALALIHGLEDCLPIRGGITRIQEILHGAQEPGWRQDSTRRQFVVGVDRRCQAYRNSFLPQLCLLLEGAEIVEPPAQAA